MQDERGIALPVSLALLTLVTLLGAVSVGQAVTATDGTDRDSRVKRALQAASAGIDTALWRMNTFAEEINDPTSPARCLVRVETAEGPAFQFQPTDTKVDPVTGAQTQWCPTGIAEALGNDEVFHYTVSGFDFDQDGLHSTIDRKVVSTGTVGGVTRRVMRGVSAFDVNRLLSDYAAFSKDHMTLDNQGDIGSPEVRGSARSNGNIYLRQPNAHVYGNATPGPEGAVLDGEGGQPVPERVDGSTAPAAEPLELPPVTMPAATAVDGRVCDPVDAVLRDECAAATYTWDTASRRLTLSGGTVTLTGNVFALCSLTMTNNSTLIFEPLDASQPIRVYIDSPDNCLDSSGNPPAHSISLSNNPTIATVEGVAYPVVQLYVVGDDPPTSVLFANKNTTHVPFSLYAPHSDVTLQNHATISGGAIANRLTLYNNTAIVPATAGQADLVVGPTPTYDAQLFQDCSSEAVPAGLPQDLGC